MVLGSIGSFVALVAGMYRLGRLCFGPVVGVVAALLLLSRFFVENLAAQGYLDISYVALIVWAVALEVERPRRGASVLRSARGCRPAAPGRVAAERRLLAVVRWPMRRELAAAWRARARPRRALSGDRGERTGAVGRRWTRSSPAIRCYSLHSTAGLAQELGRTQGLSAACSRRYGATRVRIDKLPVLLGAIAGCRDRDRAGAASRARAARRCWWPRMGPIVAEGAAGASVIDRYLLGAATVVLLFCAVSVGGWSMLRARITAAPRPGSPLLRCSCCYGAVLAATTLSLSSLRTTLAYHEDFHDGLAAALHNPRVRSRAAALRLVSLPDNKLIPDARWILDSTGQHDIVARSEARADAERGAPALEDRICAGSVAVYPLGSAVFFEAIVDVGDNPLDQVPLAGFKRIYTSRYYAVYANC